VRGGGPGAPIGLALLASALVASAAAQAALRGGARAAGIAAALAAFAVALAAGRLARADAGGEGPAEGGGERAFPDRGWEGAPAERGANAALAPWRALLPQRPAAAVLGAVALAATLALAAADRAHGAQIAGLALSLLAWNAAYVARGGATAGAERAAATPRWTEAAVVAALVALGLAARLVALGRVPGGLYGDEGEFGLRALALLEGRPLPPFAVEFDQHPALFTWLQAGGMSLAGRDVAGVRLASALAGALVVAPAYLLLRRDLGLAAAAAGAALVALSPWHAHLTRIASNNAFVSLCTVASMTAAYAAARTGRAAAAVSAGTFFGVCFYFGNKAVALPPALAAGLAALALAWPLARRHWRLAPLALAAALLAAAPELVQYARSGFYGPLLSHPLRDLVDLDAPGGPGPTAALAAQLGRALLTFVHLPDRSPFQAHGGWTLVAAGEGALLLVGVALALARPRRPLHAFLLGWLAVGLATLVLDRDPPQAHHLIGAATLPAVFAAVALRALSAQVGAAWARPALGAAVALALAAAAAAQGAHAYFVAGARRPAIGEITEVARAMAELAPSHHLVLVTPPMSWDLNSTFKYLARGVRAQVKLVELDPARRWFDPPARDVAFIVDARRRALLPAIRARYPASEVRERRGPWGEVRAVVVLVSRAEVERADRELGARRGALRSAPPLSGSAARRGSR
jgi:hypothetical protein